MERISVLEFNGKQGPEEQVGRAVSALLLESSLQLPDFLRAQMEESILHAIGEASNTPLAQSVQLGIHYNDGEPADGQSAPASARWGFFLVQKRGDAQNAARLLLDVYLYQE